MLLDKKFRIPRIWSNNELKKFSSLFKGNIVNVSGWTDEDKEGGTYQQYFKNNKSYQISNYKKELKGLQGFENEFYLDLTEDLDESLINKFEVVFNHTTLEHIYDVKKAFKNLCLLSNDIVIIIVPFLQPMHGNYDDYWRFSPLTIKNLFEESNFSLLYLNSNNHKKSSVYIFAIASKNPERWKNTIPYKFEKICKNVRFDEFPDYIGCRSIYNSIFYRIKRKFMKKLRKLKSFFLKK